LFQDDAAPTGLEFLLGLVFYKDSAPTVLKAAQIGFEKWKTFNIQSFGRRPTVVRR
jgi:hypothetical protein